MRAADTLPSIRSGFPCLLHKGSCGGIQRHHTLQILFSCRSTSLHIHSLRRYRTALPPFWIYMMLDGLSAFCRTLHLCLLRQIPARCLMQLRRPEGTAESPPTAPGRTPPPLREDWPSFPSTPSSQLPINQKTRRTSIQKYRIPSHGCFQAPYRSRPLSKSIPVLPIPTPHSAMPSSSKGTE